MMPFHELVKKGASDSHWCGELHFGHTELGLSIIYQKEDCWLCKADFPKADLGCCWLTQLVMQNF